MENEQEPQQELEQQAGPEASQNPEPATPEPEAQATPAAADVLRAMSADARVAHFIAAVMAGEPLEQAKTYLDPAPPSDPEPAEPAPAEATEPELGLYESPSTSAPAPDDDASAHVLARQKRSIWDF